MLKEIKKIIHILRFMYLCVWIDYASSISLFGLCNKINISSRFLEILNRSLQRKSWRYECWTVNSIEQMAILQLPYNFIQYNIWLLIYVWFETFTSELLECIKKMFSGASKIWPYRYCNNNCPFQKGFNTWKENVLNTFYSSAVYYCMCCVSSKLC